MIQVFAHSSNKVVIDMCDMREVGKEWGIKPGKKLVMVHTMIADGISLEKSLKYAKLDYDTYKQLDSKYGSCIKEHLS